MALAFISAPSGSAEVTPAPRLRASHVLNVQNEPGFAGTSAPAACAMAAVAVGSVATAGAVTRRATKVKKKGVR
eukprot:4853347-Amphidinium_carterae.1